jgi:hypothetical protein
MKKALLLFGLLTALTIPSGLWAQPASHVTVMVTGTSGSLSHSSAVTVTVN